MILATEQELKILLNRIKFLEEELEKTKKSLIATKDPTQISPHQKQINHLMEIVNEIAGYDIRQKKSRAIECVIPRYAFIRLAYDMYPNKQFVMGNLKIIDRWTIYHILSNFDRLYSRHEGLRVFMGKVLEKL